MRSWSRANFVRAVLAAVSAAACSDATVPPETRPAVVTLFHTSDLHSRVFPEIERVSATEAALGLGRAEELRELGGLSRLGALLARERELSSDHLYLDSGDALEGSITFTRFHGEPELHALGALGLSAMALGNHELSLRVAELAARLSSAAFPVLAANAEFREPPLAGVVEPWRVVRAGRVRIGVVGVMNPVTPPALTAETNRWSIDVTGTVAAVQAAIDALRDESDVVVALSHLGLDGDRELVTGTSGLDLVLGGHQHVVTESPEWAYDCARGFVSGLTRACEPRAVAIVHSGAYGHWLSRIDVALDWRAGTRRVSGVELQRFAVTEEVASDAELDAWLLPYEAALQADARAAVFVPERLARRAPDGGDTALGNAVADSLRRATAADVAIFNASALRADAEPGLLGRAGWARLLPFEDRVTMRRVPAEALRRALERGVYFESGGGCGLPFEFSGLAVRLDCGSCRAAADDCLVLLESPGGVPAPEEFVRLAAPDYVLEPRSILESLAAADVVEEWESFAELTWGDVVTMPSCEASRCALELVSLEASECARWLGEGACPVDPPRARAQCLAFGCLSGAVDGRLSARP